MAVGRGIRSDDTPVSVAVVDPSGFLAPTALANHLTALGRLVPAGPCGGGPHRPHQLSPGLTARSSHARPVHRHPGRWAVAVRGRSGLAGGLTLNEEEPP